MLDGTLPPAGAEGSFIIGATHAPAPETIAKEGVPRSATTAFIFSSRASTIYNIGSLARFPGTRFVTRGLVS